MGCKCSRIMGPKPLEVRCVYSIGNVLGSGAFGEVRSCVHKASLQHFAVKIMAKNPQLKGDRKQANVNFSMMFRNEVEMLQELDHHHVIRYFEFYEDQHFLYAIIEKCEGGELFQRISRKQKFFESDASAICRQMLQGIQYLHKKNIVHRDIKAQNFLFKNADKDSNLVIIDFGMATKLESEDQYLTRLCGSPHYVSPELVQKYYRFTVDLWAVGVVLYLMMYGKYPFEGSDRDTIMKKVSSSYPQFNEGPSAPLMDFLKGLLNKDPKKRLTAAEALAHPFLSQEEAPATDTEVPPKVVREFERKMTMEKDFVQQREYERKLTEMNERYIQRRRSLSSVTSSRRRSSLVSEPSSISSKTSVADSIASSESRKESKVLKHAKTESTTKGRKEVQI